MKNDLLITRILYFLAVVFCFTMFYIQVSKKEIKSQPKFIMNIDEGSSITKTATALWGPINIHKNKVMVEASIKTNKLTYDYKSYLIKLPYESWVSGEVNFIKAQTLEDSSNQLFSKNKLIQIFKKNENKKGEKEIYEVYSFPFSLWIASGVEDGSLWRESKLEINKKFQFLEAGKYYILVEYNSYIHNLGSYNKHQLRDITQNKDTNNLDSFLKSFNNRKKKNMFPNHFPANYLKLSIVENRGEFIWYLIATIVLFVLLISSLIKRNT